MAAQKGVLGPRMMPYHRVPGQLDQTSPVESLDQLYLQATALDPILRVKAQKYAATCEGWFATTVGNDMCVKWTDVVNKPFIKNKIKWGNVKNPERAIEKTLKSYGNDVSYLMDLCRQAVIFESVHDIVRCLKEIAKDPSVVVVRIKNRLDRNYDSSISAGYRDVVLNIRILTSETLRLGLETHVCELQLILKKFAELKHEEGHKRYVIYRTRRGE